MVYGKLFLLAKRQTYYFNLLFYQSIKSFFKHGDYLLSNENCMIKKGETLTPKFDASCVKIKSKSDESYSYKTPVEA